MRASIEDDNTPSPWQIVADLGGDPETDVLLVQLNGVEQENVISFDTETGSLVRYATDHNGLLVMSSDKYVTEALRGAVTVSFRKAV